MMCNKNFVLFNFSLLISSRNESQYLKPEVIEIQLFESEFANCIEIKYAMQPS